MRIIPRQSIAQVPHLSLCVFTLVCIPLALTTDGESSFRKSEDGSEILFLVIVFLFTTDSLHSLSLVSGLFYDAILEPLGYSRVFEDLRPGEMH